MPGPSDPGFDTLALHAGAAPDPATGARAVPIHLTTSFVFESSEHAASLFNMERAGHVYSRISNPTTAVFEERVAALEGGVGAIATASGQAALHMAIATLLGAGSHIVASAALYGGSHNLLAYTLPRFGIETTFVNPRDHDGWRAAIRPNTRLLFGESLGNPGLDVLDIPRVSSIAHDAGVPLLVDATFTTPWLRSLRSRRRIRVHPATVCPPRNRDRRRTWTAGADWEKRPLPELTQPRGLSRHGASEESTVGVSCARREAARLRRLHEPAHRGSSRRASTLPPHGAPREHARSWHSLRRRRWSSGRLPELESTRAPLAKRLRRAVAGRCSAST